MEPRWPGRVSPCATSRPSAAQKAVEKSMLSFSTPEYVVRTTVSAISSAMEWTAFLNNSNSTGSRAAVGEAIGKRLSEDVAREGRIVRQPWPDAKHGREKPFGQWVT